MPDNNPAGGEHSFSEATVTLRAMDAFKTCRDEVKHEYEVLSSRLTSYITSQSFLVSAYAISMGNLNPVWGGQFRWMFPSILTATGLLLSYQAYPGIARVCEIINLWHDRQSELVAQNPGLEAFQLMQLPGVARLYRRSLWFAQSSPWTFGGVWVLLALLTAWLSIFH